jgi:hypothetical protein
LEDIYADVIQYGYLREYLEFVKVKKLQKEMNAEDMKDR